MKSNYQSIDEYISTFPESVQKILTEMRQLIQAEAPEATEKISYQMPTFDLNGNLVHFAAFKQHIGLYPGPAAIVTFAEPLQPYKTSKGAIQFPLDQPLPKQLIKQIVALRVQENRLKAPKQKPRAAHAAKAD